MSAAIRAAEMEQQQIADLRDALSRWVTIPGNTDVRMGELSGMDRAAVARFRLGHADLSSPTRCRIAAVLGLKIVVVGDKKTKGERCVRTVDMFKEETK